MNDVSIMGERAGVIAVAKPAGLPTQAPAGIPSVESRLRQRLYGESEGGYLGVPHRLDRAVSGVLLMAATPRAARKLSRQFERREIRKAYLAVSARDESGMASVGFPSPGAEPAIWRDAMEKIPDEARARIVDASAVGGREAVTRARLRWQDHESGLMLLELEPLTGRMHQLRLQAASRGLPIVGDEIYGGPALADAPRIDPRERPILLHAWRITYTDPDSAEPITAEAPLPTHWPEWARGPARSGS
jgi:23S rRNA pseudouridine1911/1915/1917 synthase